jgi:hypothetical protein
VNYYMNSRTMNNINMICLKLYLKKFIYVITISNSNVIFNVDKNNDKNIHFIIEYNFKTRKEINELFMYKIIQNEKISRFNRIEPLLKYIEIIDK